MTRVARAACFAATFALLTASHASAQSTIRVTIAGGPHAGTYEMSEECVVQPNAYPAIHLMAFTVGTSNPKAPSTMEFFLASAKGKPDGFVVAVAFPKQAGKYPRYEIFAIPPELESSAPPLRGRGTVTVKQTATGKVATFRGQTNEGVKMEGTIDCRIQSS
jgi:hypothetical protein